MPGLRDYKVQLDEGGTWTTVASVTNEFFNRMELLSFPSVTATGVQVTISSINAGGVAGGQVPWWWPPRAPSEGAVYSVEAYGPGTAGPRRRVSCSPRRHPRGPAWVAPTCRRPRPPQACPWHSRWTPAPRRCAPSRPGRCPSSARAPACSTPTRPATPTITPAPQVQQSFSVRATPSAFCRPHFPHSLGGLLGGERRRRPLRLRRRQVLRVDGGHAAQQPRGRHGRDPRRPGLLGGERRRRPLRLRRRQVLRVDGGHAAQQPRGRHGGDPRRPGLLGGERRRRALRLRRRRVLRVDGGHAGSTAPWSPWRRPPTARATGR